MNRHDLTDMLWFVAVAEERSFTRAAARLGTSQSTLSHTVKQLEERLGMRLLTRTTRNVSPTEAGERLLRAVAPRIEDIESDVTALMALRDKPAGAVRLTLSDHALQWAVWPRLKPVIEAYPDIAVELFIDNAFRNIVEERFDAGVRLGESLEKDMIAVRISPDWRLVAVASPVYLALRPAPITPHDLAHHNCINHRLERSGALYPWEFEKDGRALKVRVAGQLIFNGSLAMVDAVLSGLGIGFLPENLVIDDIRSGRLTQVLDDWCPSFPGYFLYYPDRRRNSPAFSVIVDALRHPDA